MSRAWKYARGGLVSTERWPLQPLLCILEAMWERVMDLEPAILCPAPLYMTECCESLTCWAPPMPPGLTSIISGQDPNNPVELCPLPNHSTKAWRGWAAPMKGPCYVVGQEFRTRVRCLQSRDLLCLTRCPVGLSGHCPEPRGYDSNIFGSWPSRELIWTLGERKRTEGKLSKRPSWNVCSSMCIWFGKALLPFSQKRRKILSAFLC